MTSAPTPTPGSIVIVSPGRLLRAACHVTTPEVFDPISGDGSSGDVSGCAQPGLRGVRADIISVISGHADPSGLARAMFSGGRGRSATIVIGAPIAVESTEAT